MQSWLFQEFWEPLENIKVIDGDDVLSCHRKMGVGALPLALGDGRGPLEEDL